MTTFELPKSSSTSSKARPRAGGTPRTRNREDVAEATCIRDRISPPTRLRLCSLTSPMSTKEIVEFPVHRVGGLRLFQEIEPESRSGEPYPNELVRIGKWQLAKQDAVDETEDACARPNPEGESENRNERDPGECMRARKPSRISLMNRSMLNTPVSGPCVLPVPSSLSTNSFSWSICR